MKYPFVRQHSEEDCGAACLASIAKHYGVDLSLRQIRDRVGTGQTGTNLWGLQQGAAQLGFNSRSVKASPEVLQRLQEVPLPAILHWQGNHWVVLYGKRGEKFVVVDPGIGVRYLTPIELSEGWRDWVMLLLEPDRTQLLAQAEDAPKSGFERVFHYLSTYRGLLIQAIALNLIIGLLSIASPVLLQILTDDVLLRGDFKLLNILALTVMFTTFVSSSLGLVQSNLIAHFAQRLELGLILEFCQRILKLPLSYYEARRSGEVVSRLQDIQQLNYLVSQVIVNLPSQFFIALISIGLMIAYNWKLTSLAIGVAIAMTASVVLFQPMLKRKTQTLLVTDADNQGVLVETFKGALTLKTIGAMPQLWSEFQGRFSRFASLNLRTNQINILNNSFSGFVSGIGSVGLLWFGSSLVMNPSENLTVGQLLAFKALNDHVFGFIIAVIGFIDEFTRVQAAAQRLAEVTDLPPEDEADANKPIATLPAHAEITCDRICFDYPGRPNLLDQVSVKIPGGQVTAIVGQSGCGKSTLAKLIAGLYPISAGTIRIGLYNQADLPLDNLRQQVVLVSQEPHFWSRSILDNLRLSTPDASFEQIVTACQLSGADAFISRLPQNYQTILGEFATNLSGGQRQRLAIARALVANPPVLILDESTSGLDPASEAELLDRLFEHRQGKTTLVISHRPSVVQRADWLVLMEQGQVKWQGPTAAGADRLETLYDREPLSAIGF